MHYIPQDRYTRHEVTASRAGSPSGRTLCEARNGLRRWGLRGQIRATQPIDARYQLFLSEGKGSCGFRYLKNHPFEAVERKPKPARTITVIRTPTANVIMLPPWS
jgi:hypothetical protein